MTRKEAENDYNYIIKELNKRRMAPCGFCTSSSCIPLPAECAYDDFVIDKAIAALKTVQRIPEVILELKLQEERYKKQSLDGGTSAESAAECFSKSCSYAHALDIVRNKLGGK